MNTISNDTRIALLCELAHEKVKEDFHNISNYGTTKYINEDLQEALDEVVIVMENIESFDIIKARAKAYHKGENK